MYHSKQRATMTTPSLESLAFCGTASELLSQLNCLGKGSEQVFNKVLVFSSTDSEPYCVCIACLQGWLGVISYYNELESVPAVVSLIQARKMTREIEIAKHYKDKHSEIDLTSTKWSEQASKPLSQFLPPPIIPKARLPADWQFQPPQEFQGEQPLAEASAPLPIKDNTEAESLRQDAMRAHNTQENVNVEDSQAELPLNTAESISGSGGEEKEEHPTTTDSCTSEQASSSSPLQPDIATTTKRKRDLENGDNEVTRL
jgi:hypothetical protein